MNFEQRWNKATRWTEFGLRCRRISHWHDALIKIERISWILSPNLTTLRDGTIKVPEDDPKVFVSREEDPENWHVQVEIYMAFFLVMVEINLSFLFISKHCYLISFMY